LRIVDQLAGTWGVTAASNRATKTAWFTLSLPS
jgi:hypothetical protein